MLCRQISHYLFCGSDDERVIGSQNCVGAISFQQTEKRRIASEVGIERRCMGMRDTEDRCLFDDSDLFMFGVKSKNDCFRSFQKGFCFMKVYA